ncbi:MAG: bifunctional folylpolyglutamate synthase/dihydrofolate synthase, partial [Fidelibacterota bacterium]
RTRALLRRCGDPHKHLPVIHIAGTNGKGSTAAMICSILRETGRKVGLYTSPHLMTFNERIRVDGVTIPDHSIQSFLESHRRDIDLLGSTFFETTTALSFTHFSEEKVDVAVVEVGLGGRLDSSNVVRPVVSVLTPIDYDHMEFLGHDLPSIAREKCGILKQGVPVVVAPQHTAVEEVITQMVKKTRTRSFRSKDLCPATRISLHTDFTRFRLGNTDVDLPLPGRHQVINAQTAVATCRVFDPGSGYGHFRRGLKKVRWPGRLQKLSINPPVYYDVAHNPHGLQAVITTLGELFPGKSVGAVCALKRTKTVEPMARLLQEHDIHVITTVPDEPDFFPPRVLADELTRWGVTAEPAPGLADALQCRFDDRLSRDIWLIFGSHYIAGGVYDEFGFSLDKEMN